MVWFFGSKKDDKNKTEINSPMEETDNDEENSELLNKDKKVPEIILKNILTKMGISDEVHREETADEVYLQIRGEYGALLIGRRGQTLDSLEYLLNRICSLAAKTRCKKIVIDAEDYRKKRKDKIVTLVQKLANKVASTKKPEIIRPMNPVERKIVHTMLQDHSFVKTTSQGEGHLKKIIISYKIR